MIDASQHSPHSRPGPERQTAVRHQSLLSEDAVGSSQTLLEQHKQKEFRAMVRWSSLVVGLLLMDICIGLTAVALSNMDGGHRPLERSDVTKLTPTHQAKPKSVTSDYILSIDKQK